MRLLIPVSLAAALLLAGCGGSSSSGLDSVSVTGGKTPTVKVEKNFTTSATTSKIIKKGTGDKVAEGEAVTLDYVAVNGRTGKTFDSSFKTGAPLKATISSESLLPGFVKGIVGKHVGDRVLIAIPPKDGFNQANSQLGLKKSDTMVFVMDIVKADVVPKTATGTAKKLPATTPTLKLDAKKHPSKFVKTASTSPKVAKANAQVAIEGTGPVVKAGQSITIQYIGQVYPAGKVFDETWSRASTTFQIGTGQLIKCWDDLLPGQKVGSRVILECPAATAYGKTGQAPYIKAGDTLIFAVDLLAAS